MHGSTIFYLVFPATKVVIWKMFILGGLDVRLLQWLMPVRYLNYVDIYEKQEQIFHKYTATINGFKFGR